MKPAILAVTLVGTLMVGFAMRRSTADSGADRASHAPVIDLDGAAVDPFDDSRARAVTLIFMDTECPVAGRAVPQLNRLHGEFSPRGVRFWLVYPNDDTESIRRHIRDFGLHMPVLRDPHQVLVARSGVAVIPEAAVFASDGRLRYRGRIDDRQVSLGAMRPVATSVDLRDALDALLVGRLAEPVFTAAVGCYIRRVS